MSREARLQTELVEMARNPPSMCSAGPVEGNLNRWRATIAGPPMSPYQGGQFKLGIEFPPQYPNRPPHVWFETKIYHMNINSDGGICLDVLKNKWKPTITLGQLLLAICNLMTHPNPDDPLDWPKREVYVSDRIQYSKNAQKWTAQYAS